MSPQSDRRHLPPICQRPCQLLCWPAGQLTAPGPSIPPSTQPPPELRPRLKSPTEGFATALEAGRASRVPSGVRQRKGSPPQVPEPARDRRQTHRLCSLIHSGRVPRRSHEGVEQQRGTRSWKLLSSSDLGFCGWARTTEGLPSLCAQGGGMGGWESLDPLRDLVIELPTDGREMTAN